MTDNVVVRGNQHFPKANQQTHDVTYLKDLIYLVYILSGLWLSINGEEDTVVVDDGEGSEEEEREEDTVVISTEKY